MSAPRRVQVPKVLRSFSVGRQVELLLAYAPTTKGRGTRTELCVTVFVVSFFGALGWEGMGRATEWLAWPSRILSVVLIFAPIGSACVRRMHDTGRRWTGLLLVLIPYIGLFLLLFLLSQPTREQLPRLTLGGRIAPAMRGARS